ncbi:MAG: dihydropteroate synthase [Candidatus Methylacidiphilales bacterium]
MQTFKSKKYINCKGKLVSLEKPTVMGILNITNDSFFDGGKHNSIDNALFQVEKMLNEGATFIDIGAQSTRPGADMIGQDAELKAAIPVIEKLAEKFPEMIISIDTFRAEVAKQAIAGGAAMINDVSGGEDDLQMFETVINLKVPYILMHKQGDYKTMHHNPTYQNVVTDIMNYFIPKVEFLKQNGVVDLILDLGFGFGKNLEHNYELISKMDRFKIFELPILSGVSRKKMIQNVIGADAQHALNGTTVVNTIALMKGAKILRVHDVKEAVEAVKIFEMLNYEC